MAEAEVLFNTSTKTKREKMQPVETSVEWLAVGIYLKQGSDTICLSTVGLHLFRINEK